MSSETSPVKRFAAGTGDTHARSGPPGRAEEGIVNTEKVPDQVVADAKMEARLFLVAQEDTNHSHGAGWDERALIWLMVKFYQRGRNFK